MGWVAVGGAGTGTGTGTDVGTGTDDDVWWDSWGEGGVVQRFYFGL